MFQIIIGCVLANILTIAIIGLALYLVYRKNEDRLKALDSKIEQKVEREQVAKGTGTNKDESATNTPKKRAAAKVYPNDPCPCGSGKKYKQCCGRKPV